MAPAALTGTPAQKMMSVRVWSARALPLSAAAQASQTILSVTMPMSAPKATSAMMACAILPGISASRPFLAAATAGVQEEITRHVMMAMLAPVTIDVKATRARARPFKDAQLGGNAIPMQTAMMAFPAPATGAMSAGASARQSPFAQQAKAAIPMDAHAVVLVNVPTIMSAIIMVSVNAPRVFIREYPGIVIRNHRIS